jgi:hypothetical protein
MDILGLCSNFRARRSAIMTRDMNSCPDLSGQAYVTRRRNGCDISLLCEAKQNSALKNGAIHREKLQIALILLPDYETCAIHRNAPQIVKWRLQ